MEVIDKEILLAKAIKLYAIGDEHLGTIHCVEDEIAALVDQIRSEDNSYWVNMGDMGEFITPDDKRFDPSLKVIPEWVDQDDIAHCIEQRAISLFSPIKDKCLGLLYGNHEDAYRIHKFGNVHQHICDGLGVDNLGYSCFLRLFVRSDGKEKTLEQRNTHCFIGVLTHGSGWAVTKGAKLNRLHRFMNAFDGDFYAHGHMHDMITDTKPYLTVSRRSNRKKIKAAESVGAVTGSWFRTYTQGTIASYGEKKSYPATKIGCPVFVINPYSGEIDVHRAN
jgi:hypothetical protein